MNKALFIKDGIKQEIFAKSILSRKDYLEKYQGYLFCPHPNCTAHLSFAETPIFKEKKIFKTSRNSNHSEDCPFKISYTPTGKRIYSSETINQSLSDRHKRDILKKLYYRNQDTEVSTSSGSYSAQSEKKKTADTDSSLSPKAIASISADALPAPNGTREPVVKKRRCSDILPEDVGRLLALDDYATGATINDDYVEIMLESNTKLLFYNSFKDSSPAAFSLVKNLAGNIDTTKQDILICFIGVVEKKASGYQIQIMDPSLVTFNDSYIYNYNTIE